MNCLTYRMSIRCPFAIRIVGGFSTSGSGACIALMQLGVSFELETPKFIVRQIFMLFFINCQWGGDSVSLCWGILGIALSGVI